jgi:hypothetical protein
MARRRRGRTERAVIEGANLRLVASRFAVVSLGARDLLGLRPTWDGVVERLRRYNLGRVLDLLGRVSAILDRYDGTAERDSTQIYVLRALFGPGSRAERELDQWLDANRVAGNAPPFVLFHERQILNTAKAAFLALPVAAAPDTEPPVALGEALLMVNDLIERDSSAMAHVDPASEAGRREWEQFLMATAMFEPNGVELHEVARGFLLYHTDRPHLRALGTYVDLPEMVSQITGVPSDALWRFVSSLNARGTTLDWDTWSTTTSSFDPHRYWGDSGIYSPAEVDGLLGFLAQDGHTLKTYVEENYRFDSMRPLSVLPFARRPVIMIGGRAFIPSMRRLRDKLVRGTHHLFIDPDLVPDSGQRKRYLDYLGLAFEDYVRDLLSRTYTGAIGRFIPEERLKEVCQGRVCDGVVHVGDVVVLLEVKAKAIPLAVREGTGWDQYLKKVDEIYLEGARQIHATVDAIRAGALRDCGLDPDRIRVYVPVVVTLEDIPMNEYLYRRIMDGVRAEELLSQPGVLPPQGIDVGELEMWESLTYVGRNVPRRLELRTSSSETASISFSNFMIARGETFERLKSAYLSQVYNELTDRTLDDFRERQRRSRHTE